MKTVSSHQPNFLPWTGYWNKVMVADVHIMTCGVKIDEEHGSRVKVGDRWLTIPINKSSTRLIKDALITDLKAVNKLGKTIRQAFARSKYPERVNGIAGVLETWPFVSLMMLNLVLFEEVTRQLGQSRLPLIDFTEPDPNATKTERLNQRIETHVGPPIMTKYLAGAGALDYLEGAEINAKVMVQRVRKDVRPGSILEVLAYEDDPLAYVLNAASWGPLMEDSNEDFGHQSARG